MVDTFWKMIFPWLVIWTRFFRSFFFTLLDVPVFFQKRSIFSGMRFVTDDFSEGLDSLPFGNH